MSFLIKKEGERANTRKFVYYIENKQNEKLDDVSQEEDCLRERMV